MPRAGRHRPPRRAALALLAGLSCCAPERKLVRSGTPPPAGPPIVAPADEVPSPAPPTASASNPETPPRPCEPGWAPSHEQLLLPVEGSFTEPKQSELYAGVQCPNTQTPSTALLRRAGAEWKIVRGKPNAWNDPTVPRCQKLPGREGRDLLICHHTLESGGGVYDSVFVLDFARPVDDERVRLAEIADDAATACQGRRSVVVGGIESFDLVDLDNDGVLDVRIRLRAARVRIPRQPACPQPPTLSVGPRPPRLPRPPLQTIDLLTKGTELRPTDASRVALEKLDALRRE